MLVRKIYNTSLFVESLGAAALLQAPTSLLYNDKSFVRHRGMSSGEEGRLLLVIVFPLSIMHLFSFHFNWQILS